MNNNTTNENDVINGTIIPSGAGSYISKVENRVDHDETKLMESEWREIKELSSRIEIVPPSFDFFSLFLGGALSTGISSALLLISSNSDSIEFKFYMIATVFLLIIVIISQRFERKNIKKLNESKIHSDYLKDKIKKIDDRIAKG